MVRRALLSLTCLALTALGLAAACNDETPSFGRAGGLKGETPTDNGASSGGVTPDSGGGGGGACTPPVEGGICPSYMSDVFPLLAPDSGWGCGQTGCHVTGGLDPKPLVTADDVYNKLTTYKIGSRLYIDPKCGDPDASAILCNLAGNCGTKQMPPDGGTPDLGKMGTLTAWLKCGAPR
jgi:hypothetical protein